MQYLARCVFSFSPGGNMGNTARRCVGIQLGALLCIWAATALSAPTPTVPTAPVPALHSTRHSPDWFDALVSKKWTGDLDGMAKRRVIRALVVYSPTYYFIDRGTERGASFEALTQFEVELNNELKTKNLRIRVAFVPVRRDDLIPALLDGRGDIAASGITITAARQKLIDFSDPLVARVNEIIVTGPASPTLHSLDELSGQEVFVRASSSFYEHLRALNTTFQKAGKAPIKLKLAPESLEDEDLLQMLNAGLVQVVVVDDMIAQLWTQV